MNHKENSSQNKVKNKKWLFFATGMLAGIVLSIFVIFLIGKFPEERIVFLTPKNEILKTEIKQDTLEEEEEILQKTVVKYVYDTIPFVEKDTILLVMPEKESLSQFEDVEFAITPPEHENFVALDIVIATRKIKPIVKTLKEEESPQKLPIEIFEVQQWSTPIRNSITYQRKNSSLRIKGMDISKIEIHFYDGEYYLISGSSSYAIPNNEYYERLVEQKPIQF